MMIMKCIFPFKMRNSNTEEKPSCVTNITVSISVRNPASTDIVEICAIDLNRQ